jgi:uncharacterized protein
VLLIALALALATVAPSTPPSPTRFVTDGAGLLSASTQAELEQRLERYQRDTGHQVLLWIGRTTDGEPIESWAVRAFAAWKVGRKGLDDGVAIFILAADRRIRIEVGYGLEDRVPDAVASQIIADQMVPRLRAADPDGAARAGVSGVLAAVGGETGAPRDAAPGRTEIGRGQLILVGLIALLVLGFIVTNPRLALMLLMTLDSHGSRRGGGWGGGGWGGGFGGGGNWGGGGFGGGGFSGGGGRSGGGGASGSW